MDKELPLSPWPEWKIIDKTGEGSFGSVYRAERTERGHSFYSAIKIISIPSSREELLSVRSETGDEKSLRNYFETVMEDCIQEISTMEYFRGNSHVVAVEDFMVTEYLDEIGWDIFIRMEYLTAFADYCTGRTLSEEEVIRLGIDLCKALEYCQRLNIIHRDIKPENIFVSRFGDFKLGDFGIARELERSMAGYSKKGTYSYMAPEMYRGEPYDGRVDIYSLGLVLYRLLNHNRLPFMSLEKQLITYRDKENALMHRMAGEPLVPPAEASEELTRILLKACAFQPSERYLSAGVFRRDLERLKEKRLLLQEGIILENTRYIEPPEKTLVREEGNTPVHTHKESGEETQSVLPEDAKDAPSSGAKAAEAMPSSGAKAAEAMPSSGEKAEKAGPSQRTKAEEAAPEPVQETNPAKIETEELKHRRSMLEIQDDRRIDRERLLREREERERRKYRKTAFWIALILLVGIAVAMIVILFVKDMIENTVREQTQDLLVSLENRGTPPSEDEGEDFAVSIQSIRDKATQIVNSLETYDREGTEGDRLRYRNGDGQIMKVLVYPARSPEGLYEEYYYWDGALFFAYIWYGDEINMYYYRDGMLIRWIDDEGNSHDNDQEDPEYTERGDRYWLRSIAELYV